MSQPDAVETLIDSRRLTGPNLLLPGPGAVVDVAMAADRVDSAVELWEEEIRGILSSVGWGAESIAVRRVPGGASLAFTAPIDALYAATEVNEWAWSAVVERLGGAGSENRGAAARRLRQGIDRESNPALLALRGAAHNHGVLFLSDDDQVSVGMGTGARTWPVTSAPDPAGVVASNASNWSTTGMASCVFVFCDLNSIIFTSPSL